MRLDPTRIISVSASPIRRLGVGWLALSLSACAGLAPERGYRETQDLLAARVGQAPAWPVLDDPARDLPSTPLGVDDAIRLAYLHNPRIRAMYARIGLGRADLEVARRISNPGFAFSRLTPRDAPGTQITRSLSLSLSDLLLLPARKRMANAEFERLQRLVADELLALALATETAWYELVGAMQIAAMRDKVAHAAEQSAVLAQRFVDAGNIERLQLAQEQAAASRARIAAVRAAAAVVAARSAFTAQIGVPNSAGWRVEARLPAPSAASFSEDRLVGLARTQRLDLAAAQRELAVREDALRLTLRWRWLGSIELGVEHESGTDGTSLRGPTLDLGLPIFDQGQGAIARVTAERDQARAELQALEFVVEGEARLGLDRLRAAQEIIERYRNTLLPQHEAVVARTQEQVNFMLVGVFELIRARQDELDAYQEYLEAVRDYWIAHAELRRAVGGRLPGDDALRSPSIGVEPLPDTASEHSSHGTHGQHQSIEPQ